MTVETTVVSFFKSVWSRRPPPSKVFTCFALLAVLQAITVGDATESSCQHAPRAHDHVARGRSGMANLGSQDADMSLRPMTILVTGFLVRRAARFHVRVLRRDAFGPRQQSQGL